MPPPEPTRLRVLVADDCPDTRTSLRLLLKAWGHDCAEARDGHEAVQIAQVYRPNVVLLDVLMPGLDGFEVARRLQQLDLVPAPRMIVISGHPRAASLLTAAEVRFDHYLPKPYDPRLLAALLRSYAEAMTGETRHDGQGEQTSPPHAIP